MDFSSLGKLIGGFAPMLGTVIGGPAGGAIGSIVASVFGVENSPDKIEQAIKNDPDAAVKLKKIQLDHKADLERISVDMAKAEIADKQNARKEHKNNYMPEILSISLTVIIIGVIYLLFYTSAPEESKDVLFLILGAVLKEWGGAMQYFFGTTRGSSEKTRMMAMK